MNTKTFAQQARKILIRGVKDKLRYWGFDAKGNAQEEPTPLSGGYQFRGEVYDDPTVVSLWQSLRRAIKGKGLDTVVEEAAYTWFNRMMAIRILAKNGYEPATLDFAEGAGRLPLLLQRAQRGTYPFLNDTEKKRIQPLLADYSKDAEAFAILLVGYCHAHTLLQTVFGSLDDYTELLLPDDILAEEGFLNLLNTTDAISDEEYRKVELIGWLYQFYISEKKDEVFASFKKNKKAEAADIPAATQIFTPNWIVKYMVQNTVGKIWLDLHPDSPLKANMKYLVEGNQPEYGNPIISEIAQLKLLDPAVGSGHILVEGFDLLYDMYLAEYYPPEEAVESILRHNLYGLDIDKRAAQLAQFAVLLKAATRYPEVLKKGLRPPIYAMPEPHEFSRQDVLDFLGKDGLAFADKLFDALHLMQQAQNLGSIMQFDLPEATVDYMAKRWQQLMEAEVLNFHEKALMPALSAYLPILLILCKKYEAVVANPPYMGEKKMNGPLKEYINTYYHLSKSDLFAVFMEVCLSLNNINGLMGMINQHTWMFSTSYENLRQHLLNSYGVCSMLHLGPHTFEEISGEVVQSTAFVLTDRSRKSKGNYFRLIKYSTSEEKKVNFEKRISKFIDVPQNNFYRTPYYVFAYWLREDDYLNFEKKQILNIGKAKQGIKTGENDYFLKLWHEIDFNKKNNKWFSCNKGGEFRKWYGNLDYFLNWENDGFEIKNFKDEKGKLRSRPQNLNFFFKEGITWTSVSSKSIGARFSSRDNVFESAGAMFFLQTESILLNSVLAYLNSKVADYYLEALAPGMTFTEGAVNSIPFITDLKDFDRDINVISNSCIEICKKNWNSYESSWEFEKPLLLNKQQNLPNAYDAWSVDAIHDFFDLLSKEENLNSIFIQLYNLQNRLSPEVPLKDITILQEELNSKDLEALEQDFRKKGKEGITLPIRRDVVMQQFISYLVGICMGRYRLDKPGLHIAHPNPSEAEIQAYPWNGHTVEIDEDAILPLMGSESEFPDDALERIKQLLDAIWGVETRTENLNFLEECLDMDLEKYLVKHFWKDHCKRYKKKPIYWLFSSETGAFQVLVYMHRMNAFTVERIREKYLLPHIKHLRGKISMMEARAAQLNSQEARQLDRLRKDLLECEQYEQEIKGFADRQIVFDLDDGVTVNYGLFEGVVAAIK